MARKRRKKDTTRSFPGSYQPVSRLSPVEIEAILAHGLLEDVRHAALSAALHGAESEWGECVCRQLARHADPVVRGNALLGFGHLARRFGRLDRSLVQPLIEAGLRDDDEHVRGQADAAADDVKQFLGWTIRKPYDAA
jgi:hypothetical protein